MEERRAAGSADDRKEPSLLDQAKFSTQREVTYVLLVIFAGVVVEVLLNNDQSERSMVLQTVINLTLLAVGYWLGASKAAADQGQAMSRIAEGSAPATAAAVAAAAPSVSPLKADDVTINAETATVNTPLEDPPKIQEPQK